MQSKPMTDSEGEVRELTIEHAHRFKRGRPPLPSDARKRRISMMLDPDVLDKLKADGPGWQTRANALLRDGLGLG